MDIWIYIQKINKHLNRIMEIVCFSHFTGKLMCLLTNEWMYLVHKVQLFVHPLLGIMVSLNDHKRETWQKVTVGSVKWHCGIYERMIWHAPLLSCCFLTHWEDKIYTPGTESIQGMSPFTVTCAPWRWVGESFAYRRAREAGPGKSVWDCGRRRKAWSSTKERVFKKMNLLGWH